MKKFNFLKFSKGHYFGIAVLLILIGIMQIFIFWYKSKPSSTTIALSQDEKNWLASQNEIDSLKEQTKQLEKHYKQKLKNLEELKKSILQKAFSGELLNDS